MAGRVAAQRRQEVLADAVRYRLASQVVRSEPAWPWAVARKAMLRLGTFLVVLGRWFVRQGMQHRGRAVEQAM